MKRLCISTALAMGFAVFALPAPAIDGAYCFGITDRVEEADPGAIPEAFMTAKALQCCNCCYGGFVPSGSERPCVVTTPPERCHRRGWVCYGYVLCP